MLGLTALSSVSYELWTVDSNLKSLRDLDPQKNKIGLTAAKVSVPAIFLQMASEQINGIGKHAAFDPLTVSLAQPDGLISLLAGGSTVDSYLFAPPFSQQMRDKPNVHRVWSSTELFGSPITALASWTTARFHRDNPKHGGGVRCRHPRCHRADPHRQGESGRHLSEGGAFQAPGGLLRQGAGGPRRALHAGAGELASGSPSTWPGSARSSRSLPTGRIRSSPRSTARTAADAGPATSARAWRGCAAGCGGAC